MIMKTFTMIMIMMIVNLIDMINTPIIEETIEEMIEVAIQTSKILRLHLMVSKRIHQVSRL